jgi:antirestriction protein ArdC
MSKEKINVYEIVTERILKELENGNIPWNKPWVSGGGAVSYNSGKPYSLLNQMLLDKEGEYLTFKQVQEMGGKVKKGEKSQIVVFFKPLEVKEMVDGKEEVKTIPILKYYNVFEVSQCEGIEPKWLEKDKSKLKEFNPIEKAEEVAMAYVDREGIRVDYGGMGACYKPGNDSILMPDRENFIGNAEYYSTLFHELVHSTGHESRLDRLSKDAHFGSAVYSKEELVAEIGAASMMNQLGIDTDKTMKNSAAYVQSWIAQLRDDKKLIVSAAGKAEKAVNLIRGDGEAKEMLKELQKDQIPEEIKSEVRSAVYVASTAAINKEEFLQNLERLGYKGEWNDKDEIKISKENVTISDNYDTESLNKRMDINREIGNAGAKKIFNEIVATTQVYRDNGSKYPVREYLNAKDNQNAERTQEREQ